MIQDRKRKAKKIFSEKARRVKKKEKGNCQGESIGNNHKITHPNVKSDSEIARRCENGIRGQKRAGKSPGRGFLINVFSGVFFFWGTRTVTQTNLYPHYIPYT